MLVIKQKIEFTLNLQPFKLLQIEPAYDNTLVLLVLEQQQFNYEKILHVTQTGHIINKYTFESNINSIAMISPYQIATTTVQQSCLMVVNLIQSRTEKRTHIFNKQAIDSIELFVFPLSSLFCISQYSLHSRNSLKLSYYSQKQKQVQILYEEHQNQLQNMMFLSKVNNHSEIAWYIRNYKQNYEEIVIHDIIINNDLKKESRVRKIRIKDLNFISYQKEGLLNITKIWKFRNQQYLVLLTAEDYLAEFQHYNQHQNQHKTSIFLFLNHSNKTIRPPKFILPTNSLQTLNNIHFAEQFSVIVTNKLKIPEFYQQVTNSVIDNRSEKLITSQQTIDISDSIYFYPSYEYNSILKAKYQNILNKFELCIDKIVRVSQVYVHFLLAINENFDDDLLQDSLQLLKNDEQN